MHLQAEAGLFVMLDLREFLEESSKVGSVLVPAGPFFLLLLRFFLFSSFYDNVAPSSWLCEERTFRIALPFLAYPFRTSCIHVFG